MNVFEAVGSRRSIRKFKPNPIPKEHVKILLESAIWTPSAGNIQPWNFIVVDDPKTIDLIKKSFLQVL